MFKSKKQKLKIEIREPMPVDAELAERNAARLAKAKVELGNRHILHPDNPRVDWGWKTQ